MFVNSFRRQWGFRPLIYVHGWLATINRKHSLPTGRQETVYAVNRLYKFTLLTQFTRFDSQTSQATGPTGHNIHAHRKGQNTRILPLSEERRSNRKMAVTDSRPLHTHNSYRLHAKAAKITDITPSVQQNMPLWHPLPTSKPLKGPIYSCPYCQSPSKSNLLSHLKSAFESLSPNQIWKFPPLRPT